MCTLGILEKDNGTITKPGKDTLNYLLKTHFSTIKETAVTEYTELKIQTQSVQQLKENWITTAKLKKVFNIF